MPRPARQRPNHPLTRAYLAAHRNAWSEHHAEDRTSILNRYVVWLRARDLELVDVDPVTVSDYLAERRSQVAKATLVKCQQALVGLYRWLDAEEELPGRDPCRSLASLGEAKPDPQRTPVLTLAEYERLLASFGRRSVIECRDAAICSLMFRCGFRRSEVVRTDRNRLDLDRQVLQVWNAKSERWDDAFLAAETCVLLERYLRRRGDDALAALFVGTRGTVAPDGRMTVDAVASMLDRRARDLAMPIVAAAHSFRRGMVVAGKANGYSDTALQEMGRWDDPRMVGRYMASARRDLARAEFHRLDPTARGGRVRRRRAS